MSFDIDLEDIMKAGVAIFGVALILWGFLELSTLSMSSSEIPMEIFSIIRSIMNLTLRETVALLKIFVGGVLVLGVLSTSDTVREYVDGLRGFLKI